MPFHFFSLHVEGATNQGNITLNVQGEPEESDYRRARMERVFRWLDSQRGPLEEMIAKLTQRGATNIRVSARLPIARFQGDVGLIRNIPAEGDPIERLKAEVRKWYREEAR